MKIGIVVDHYQRDLNGYLILIDKLLLKNDFEIYLINLYHLYEIYLLDLDVIILQNSRPENLYIIKDFKKLKKNIIIIDNEGVPFGWSKDEEHINQFIKNIKHSLNYIDAYVVWSNYIKNLIEKNKINTKKIYVLGNQRFELFKKKFKYIFKKRITNKKVIVINTNTPNSNPQFTSKKKDREDIKKKLFYDTENKDDLLSKTLTYNNIIYENNLKFIENIVDDFKDYKIILNVHPFEDKKIYKKLFGNKKNIIILNNNFHLPQLYNNYHFVIQYNSTTCAETLFGGKKSISINFIDPNNILNKYYKDFCINFDEYTKLKLFLKKYINLDNEIYKIENKTQELLNYLYHNGSNDSLELISELISQTADKNQNEKINITKKYFFFLKYFLIFNYNKINIFILPARILKLALIFVINSKNFYSLKLLFKKNYKKKHIELTHYNKFLKKLNKDSFNLKILYAKPLFFKAIFRSLIAIKISKIL